MAAARSPNSANGASRTTSARSRTQPQDRGGGFSEVATAWSEVLAALSAPRY